MSMRYFSCAFLSLVLSQAFCNPEGFQLVLGDATPPSIDANGSMMIESGKNAVIQWDSFSIGELEKVRFSQADSHSAVLNRVMGGSASAILGSLDSNGQVLLINPNGVLIGNNGLIQTAGFIASTADVSNEEFFQGGDLHFAADSSASIINLGAIECPTGDIVLLARTVQNAGTLTAPEGLVTLAAGAEILIQPDGDERVFIQPTESDFASVENSGDIHALAVEIKSGRSPYLYAIKSSGNITTPKFAEQNGRIYIVADAARADVSGSLSAEGGEVRILGKEVVIDNPLDIDVSSDSEGGTVLIGGDYKGENPEIPSARMTYVGPNTSIKADARTEGNGGKVILWSTEKTAFYGSISAQGGSQSGDGGFVEVSGSYLDYQGFANTLALNGKIGELLLDPTDFSISTAVDSQYNFMQFDAVPTGVNPANILFSTLTGQLATANTTISTAGNSPGGVGAISIATSFSWAKATQLTLIANDTIEFNTTTGGVAISATMGGSFNFQAANGIQLIATGANTASITTDTGDIVLHGIGKAANRDGIYVGPGSFVASTSSGNVRMYGVAGTGIATGITLDTSATAKAAVTSFNGEIVMEGIGNATGDLSNGISLLIGTTVVANNSGAIRMTGTGMGQSAIGIFVDQNCTVSSSTGDIFMEGLGGNSNDAGLNPCTGILVLGSQTGLVTEIATSGSIKMIGTGGPANSTTGGNSVGIQINDATGLATTQIGTTGGSIHLIGRGAGTGTFNDGILLLNNHNATCISSSAVAADGADVILEGYGSINAAASDSNRGVSIQNTVDAIVTVDSDIIIIGHGGGAAAASATGENRGINFNSNSTSIPALKGGSTMGSSGLANVVLNGFGGPTNATNGLSCHGVTIGNEPPTVGGTPTGQTLIETSSGSIFINGVSIAQQSAGVAITDIGTEVISDGGGDIYINGSALVGNGSPGVDITASPEVLGASNIQTTEGGSIYIDGSATQDVSFHNTQNNVGVNLNSTSENTGVGPSIVVVSGTGNITISGQGGVGFDLAMSFAQCFGVNMVNSILQTASGNIAITGTAVAGGTFNSGVLINGSMLSTENGPASVDTGLLSITGSGSVNGSDQAHGVIVLGNVTPTTILTSNYNVVISGTGGGQHGVGTAGRPIFDGNHGVFFDGGITLESTNGNFDITGSAAGNGNFNSGVVLLANVASPSILSGAAGEGGHINITGTATQNMAAGNSNVGVDIAWLSGPIPTPFIETANHNITITGIGCATSTLVTGQGNNGVNLHFLNAGGPSALQISAGTGSIAINGFGGSGPTSGGIGVLIEGSGATAPIQISASAVGSPPGDISLFGRGGTGPTASGVLIANFGEILGQGSIQIYGDSNGTGASNDGVVINGNSSVILSGAGTFGQTLTIEGSGSKNSAATDTNIGVLINATSTVSSSTKDISISGYGGVQATSTDNYGIQIFNSTVSSTGPASGSISLYGVGGGGTSGVIGTFLEVATVTTTTGNISIEGYGGTSATGIDNQGIQTTGASVFTTTTGYLSFYGVGGGGTNNNIGVLLSGGTYHSTMGGQMSFVGYGSPNATNTDNYGIQLTASALVTNTTGNISFYGVGGTGSTDNVGVFISTGINKITTTSGNIAVEGYGGLGGLSGISGISLQSGFTTTTGNLSFYGVAGGTTGISIGIDISGAVITSTSGQMAFEGYGGTGNTGNHGIAVVGGSVLTNTSGDISFYGVGGSGSFNNIGVDFSVGSTVTNGSGKIAIEGYGAPAGTGTGNHGIGVFGAATITTAASSGSISLLGIGGTGTGTNHGVAIETGTGIATPSQVNSGTGDLSITAESGSGGTSVGLALQTFAQITTAGGNMFLTGISNATAAGNGGTGILMNENSLIQQSTAAGISNAVLNIFARGSTQPGSNSNVGLLLNAPTTSAVISSGYSIVIVAESGLSNGIATNAIDLAQNASITTALGNFGNLDITTLGVDALGGSLTIAYNSTITGGGSAASYMNFDIAKNLNIGLNSMVGEAGIASSSGAMTINTKGNLTLTAGTMLNDLAIINTTTGNLTITTFGNISLSGGSGSTAIAAISTTTGPINIRTLANPITGGGNVSLVGGTGPTAGALISTSSPTIGGIAGHIMTVGGTLTLVGGTGANAIAQIGNTQTTANTDILFTYIGGDLQLFGDANAIIGHGLPTLAASTLSGNITFQQIGGSVFLFGNSNAASAGGLAQIGHINQTAGGSTLTGNITITALGSINLTGGTEGTGSNARIGHGGQTGAATFGPSDMVIAAGTNLVLTTPDLAAGVAVIANPHAAGRLTLITDNLNPLNPAVGPSGLIIDFNSLLTTTGTGHLRIYAAQQSTDSIPTGKIINGHAYTPAPVPPAGVDTSYETWNSYFGTHVYGGPEYNIFYKFPFLTLTTPCPACPVPRPKVIPGQLFKLINEELVAVMAQLADMLPIWDNPFQNEYPYLGGAFYHGQVCMGPQGDETDCAEYLLYSPYIDSDCYQCMPNAYRFRAVIFENEVY